MMLPLIVTAELAGQDQAWLDGLRRRHYPPERNQVPAHLTLFHTLPPSAEAEIDRLLKRSADRPRPKARIADLMDLGGGVAYRIVSSDLDALREEMARALHGQLGAQDAGGWVPHVTIQNKVAPKTARALKQALTAGFEPRLIGIAGLALHRYLGGPWETLRIYRFRGC